MAGRRIDERARLVPKGGRPQVREGAAEPYLEARVVQYDTTALSTEEAIQREKLDAVRAMEGDLREVAECYQIVNNLVKEQQTGLDSMSKNVEKTTVQIQQGTGELKEARNEQSKARKRMCCLAVILVVIIAIVVVIVYVMKK